MFDETKSEHLDFAALGTDKEEERTAAKQLPNRIHVDRILISFPGNFNLSMSLSMWFFSSLSRFWFFFSLVFFVMPTFGIGPRRRRMGADEEEEAVVYFIAYEYDIQHTQIPAWTYMAICITIYPRNIDESPITERI